LIIDLKDLTPEDRADLLAEAGPVLKHVPYPEMHPDRSSSQHFYQIVIEEDIIQEARRRRIAEQRTW
jgi:hypothetical protein